MTHEAPDSLSPSSAVGPRPQRRKPWLLAIGLVVIAAFVAAPAIQSVLIPRQGSPAPGAGKPAGAANQPGTAPVPAISRDSPTQRRIDVLIQRLQVNDQDGAAYRDLGSAFLQRVRETGDPSLYPRADEALARARQLRPEDPAVLVGIGVLQLARHEFASALETGRAALAMAPIAAARGVVVDALVELGRYEEAVAELQLMVDLRPDLTSLARVSYLRELHGDLPGALEAMEEAGAAGAASAENVAYVSVLRGNLLTYLGRAQEAARVYEQALELVPDYPPAIVGLGRLAVGAGDLPRAIGLFERATRIVPLPEYVIALGEAQEAAGDTLAARRSYDLVRVEIQLLQANGVIVDVELALFEADHGDNAKALSYARVAYQARGTFRTADALAWALFKNGDIAAAMKLSREARRLGTSDPALLFHAGAIEAAAGLTSEAIRDLTAALAIDPGFSSTNADAARRLLASLP